MESIGSRIRLLRTEKSVSQAKLAKQIAVSSGNVGEWETGRSKPGADALMALSTFFDVSTDWILTGKESQQSNVQISERETNINEEDLKLIQKLLLLNDRQKGKIEERIDMLLDKS